MENPKGFRNLMLVIIFIGVLLLIFACHKEQCYECKTTVTTTTDLPGYPETFVFLQVECGDKELIEGTLTETYTMYGVPVTVRSVTVCE